MNEDNKKKVMPDYMIESCYDIEKGLLRILENNDYNIPKQNLTFNLPTGQSFNITIEEKTE